MSLSRRLAIIGTVVVVLGLLGGGIYFRLAGKKSGGNASASDTPTAGPTPEAATANFGTGVAIPVQAAKVVRGPLIISVTAAGQAAAERQTKILSQVNGRVDKVLTHEDARVGPGQLLIHVDSAQYALDLASKRAGLAQAEANFRDQTLFDDSIADTAIRAQRERIARAKTGVDAAEVAVKQAQLTLDQTKITAPFSGRVADLKVVEGQTVRTGDELVTVVDLNPIKVDVQVLESEVGYLAPGRKATVTFAAYPGQEFTGHISTINPVVNQQTRTARVTVTIPNPEGKILPGMYARVSLEAQRFDNRILVPRSAILERDNRTMLFVFKGDKGSSDQGLAEWRYVFPGLGNDSVVEILPRQDPNEMVEPGEMVLTDGHYTLIHDAHVRLVQNVQAAGGRPQ